MIPPAKNSDIRGLIWVGAILLLLAIRNPAIAGVSLGPLPKDAEEAEQRRIVQFYEAQKSEQRKLEVGRERYYLMLSNRAKILGGMAAELASRQQLVGIPSETAAYAEKKEIDSWNGTAVGVAIILACAIGFRYYLHRQNLKELASQKR
jgi:hypothetical protein